MFSDLQAKHKHESFVVTVTELLERRLLPKLVSNFVSTFMVFKLLHCPLDTHLPQPAALGVVGGKANKVLRR